MKNEKTFKALVIVGIIVATVSLSIAYAAFSTLLTINGTATVKGNSWSVHYDSTSVTATPSGSATSVSAEVSASTTDFQFDVNLLKPGDSIVYTVDVVNDGSIDATLSTITPLSVTGAGASLVTATLTGVTEGETLAVNGTKTVTITVTYNASTTVVPTTDTTATISGSLLYEQA